MAGYTVTVKVDSTGVGHAFVSLSAADGRNFTVGFYPQTPNTPYDRGFVKDDSSSNALTGGEHTSDWSSGPIDVTEQQFNAMQARPGGCLPHPADWVATNNKHASIRNKQITYRAIRLAHLGSACSF
jgi:hypothetical protein